MEDNFSHLNRKMYVGSNRGFFRLDIARMRRLASKKCSPEKCPILYNYLEGFQNQTTTLFHQMIVSKINIDLFDF